MDWMIANAMVSDMDKEEIIAIPSCNNFALTVLLITGSAKSPSATADIKRVQHDHVYTMNSMAELS
jgi:hypothetical protein